MKKTAKPSTPKPQIITSDDLNELTNKLETYLEDVRRVHNWMIQKQRRAIRVKFWPSVNRGTKALTTGIRGLMEARHNN